ncbi:uncharacterized protein LOC110458896 isoform X2 [Mizuhopecten yessoensis]|uniref:uncharacterized protein LOC110458896 isoform X2 n=1 Tax=Mizuhopecten yessoensis TaxID=6573 RepID=UPI000B45C4C6|nr:uncharacterized protein LOC110458896 isoform X2 [Mizuhopecten yessoensis]
MCKFGDIPFSLSKSAESCELQCIECKAKDYREDMCSRITYQVVQCIHCHATMLLNDICSPHKQAQAKKTFTCPTHSGNNGCAQTPICILYHLSPPINALPVGKSYEKRTSFSGSPIFFCLLWLITLFMVMSGCATVPTKGCPGPDYVIQENGFCCGVVSCKRNFSVSMCQVNYGNDTCVRCPDESFLLDPTTSETATSCVKPVCMKNRTRPSLVKSTTVDQFACPQWCECDLSFNFCGTDPCNCRRGTCPYRTILQQDCGCSPVTPSPPTTMLTSSKPRIDVSTKASDGQPNEGAIIGGWVGGVIGVLVLLGIIGVIIYKCCSKKKQGNKTKFVQHSNGTTRSQSGTSESTGIEGEEDSESLPISSVLDAISPGTPPSQSETSVTVDNEEEQDSATNSTPLLRQDLGETAV